MGIWDDNGGGKYPGLFRKQGARRVKRVARQATG
jgi:hypothetical protein